MPRIEKLTKVKEPVRLRTKKLADGSQSLYLDIYRFGKRTYEYLKLTSFRKRTTRLPLLADCVAALPPPIGGRGIRLLS